MEVDLSAETISVMDTLTREGYGVTHIYEDGHVRMAKDVAEERVGVFINSDGSVQLPHTHATHIAQAELHDAGIKFRGEVGD